MTKLEALKTCVWLECFLTDHSYVPEVFDVTEKMRDLQKYIASLPNDEPPEVSRECNVSEKERKRHGS